MDNYTIIKEEYDTTDIYHLQKCCRICMQTIKRIENAKNIFKRNITTNLLLCEAFKLITDLQISENDGLPQLICTNCDQRLSDAFALRHQAAETFICLSKIVSQNLHGDEIINVVTEDDNKFITAGTDIRNVHDKISNQNFVILNQNTSDSNEYVELEVLGEDDLSKEEEEEYYAQDNDNYIEDYDDNDVSAGNDDIVKKYQLTSENNELENAVTFQYKNDLLMLEKIKKVQQKKSTTTTTTTTTTSTTISYDNRKHECNVCSRKFIRRSNLIDHLRLHANQKLFQCTECDKSFVQSGNLKAHIRIHTKERPFVCEICKRSYNQSSALKVHYRTHTNERNYRCEQCSKAFTNSSDLKKHQRVHNPELMFKCEKCPKLFAQRNNLKNHIMNNHK